MFSKEPPPPDNPLIGRSDVVCTPHLGASTTEAQEGVALEIAEAVVSALKVLLCHQASHTISETQCMPCLCSALNPACAVPPVPLLGCI